MSRPLERRPMKLVKPGAKGKCPTGKVRYRTSLDAGVALARAQSGRPVKGRDAKVEQRHYFCPTCRGHHLTSREKKT